MSLLTLPIELPARIAQRAYEDLNAIADVARELPPRLDALDARAATVQAQLDRALSLGEALERHAAVLIEMAERFEARGDTMVELGGQMLSMGEQLRRAASIAEPMEGAVERLGRAIDRLPGGRPRPAPEAQGADEC